MKGVIWVRTGAILGFLAVAAGAFGAHALRTKLESRSLDVFETAARYQMAHALALVAIGLSGRSGRLLDAAAIAFLAGTLLFSGSLYGLALTGLPWLGPITPVGGVGFLIGWGLLAAHGGRARG